MPALDPSIRECDANVGVNMEKRGCSMLVGNPTENTTMCHACMAEAIASVVVETASKLVL